MRILFALAACSLAIAISSSNSYPQPQSEAENKPTTQDKRGTQESPLIIQGDITTKASEKPESDRKQEEEKIEIERSLAKYAGWTAAITLLLVLVTGILACFTYKLWVSTHRLVEGAENTAQRQLRAYVSVALAEIIDLKAGFTPVAHLRVKNSGQTPAYDLTAIGGIAMGESFDKLPSPTGPSAMSRSTLHASAITDQFHRTPRPLTPDEMAALVAGTITLWVYGEFRYRDTFTIQRFTKYRFQVGGTAGVHGNNMTICEEGNHET